MNVTDPEDGVIDCQAVEVIPGIFHDEGGAPHVHEGVRQNGCEGTFEARRRQSPATIRTR